MIIALTHIPAAATALFSGKTAFVRAMVLGVAVACVGAPALAGQDRDGQRNGQQQQPGREQVRPERMAPPPPPRQYDNRQYDNRQYDSRQYEMRAEEQRRQAQAQQSQEQGRRGGRLTPDERRELRRQINEAGIDLYPNAPRR